ncbi:MAG: 6-phospho-3-hexuloisomerase [Candidatus Scalindua rubra]|uniref:6-phospho-3-hexuloisomerase n=1 Tax=Candidatus Scalindua rubra TaxID=1872076 RepID=A0A1E3XB16_9BACT|nr:MAG: 6-phospho-3-hexuloisomerase [Candidatus Scalindua rubra]
MSATRTIINEISYVLDGIKEDEFKKLIDAISSSRNIFVTGQGRSGLVARTFAMRLTHIGFTCYVVGDTTTPNIEKGDMLIACSSSGTTSITCHIANLAKRLNALVVVITAHPNSELSNYANLTIEIPATETGQVIQSRRSTQFRSTLFEQACLVYLDAAILTLVRLLNREEGEMMKRHANLE